MLIHWLKSRIGISEIIPTIFFLVCLLSSESCDNPHTAPPVDPRIPKDTVKPTPPINLTAQPTGQIFIDLKWHNTPSTRTGFKVYRNDVLLTTVSSPDTESYSDVGLGCNTPYFYAITAFNEVGESDLSNTATATTFECNPTKPSNMTAVCVPGSSIELHWQDNSRNESYFWVSWVRTGGVSASNRSGSIIVPADTTHCVFKIPVCGDFYNFNVQACLITHGHTYTSWYSNTATVQAWCF